ncbi:hypothetical protein MUK42_36492 [Musa troglodytarum]|uniref:Uncharacterized protein n=1 Tax=Musa troglodytarum TaxID=320322 RepID=A0A9E7JYF9_9LILI|nr:hypothetical protein MUK42_36492 [Musa troglodytarum]
MEEKERLGLQEMMGDRVQLATLHHWHHLESREGKKAQVKQQPEEIILRFPVVVFPVMHGIDIKGEVGRYTWPAQRGNLGCKKLWMLSIWPG